MLAAAQRLLGLFAFRDVLECNQHVGLLAHVESCSRKEQRESLHPAAVREQQSGLHLTMATARLQSVHDRAANGAVLAVRPGTAAFRVLKRMQTTQRFAGWQAARLDRTEICELLGKLVHFADLAVAVHQQHDERCILVDRRQFILTRAQGLLPLLALGDIVDDADDPDDFAFGIAERGMDV